MCAKPAQIGMVGGRHKAGAAVTAPGQVHLAPAPPPSSEPADENARIDKLVSLTYDSDPAVRQKAAVELSKIDDPRAIFALLELSSDKDQGVQGLARAGLENFKEEKEAIVNLEKIFEARQEGKPIPAEEAQATRSKLMPSIERLFTKHKDMRSKMMPSIEKLFSWMPGTAPKAAPPAPAQMPADMPPGAGGEEAASAEEAPAPARPASRAHPLDAVERMASGSVDEAEAEVGVPPQLLNPDYIRRQRERALEGDEAPAGQPEYAPAPNRDSDSYPAARARHRASLSPSDSQLENAANFPLPEHLQNRPASPTAAIPSLMPEEKSEEEINEEEAERLPKSRLDYYKWAYALAVTPAITAKELKEEEDRLLKQIKGEIKLAFKLAVSRAKENGI
ncbi:MAG: HEAT repeat domain-containing protein, partial [Candidatus Micrarchaeota archaeon]|nr:HEAT repeat domain-containing protein [Candidatus Micrarchaeota archaeon]